MAARRKKATRKKTAGRKKIAKKKATPKKTARKKVARKKATPKKSTRKKTARKKVTKKKAAPKKTARKKVTKKKAAPKKPAQREVTEKKTARPVSERVQEAATPAAPPADASKLEDARIAASIPTRIGVITHYFGKVGAAVILLESGELHVGDTIHVHGHTSDFYQRVNRIEVDHVPVEVGRVGQSVGVAISQRVREHDEVFRVST